MTRVIGGWQGALNNTTERIRLVDGLGNTIDEVRYADEGEWAIRRLEQDPVDRSFTGWKWFAPHDGDGFSLSLRNPDLPNDVGQNWEASGQIGGTPGAANAGVVTANVAPLILDLEHSPAIPTAGEPVTVSVRIVDELPAAQLSVTVQHRLSGQPVFTPLPMIDGGDGLFHAQLPGRPHGSIVEFFIEADDGGVEPSRWPRPNPFGVRLTNALYQVDENAVLDFDEPWPLEQPIFRIVMSQQGRIDLTALEDANGRNSKINAEVHATLIASSPNRGVEASNGDVVEITPGVLTDLALGIFGDAEASVLFSEELFVGGENIDAIHKLANGNLVFSTASNAMLVGSDLLFGNGDLVQYNPTTGEVSLYFSELLFDGGNEDINAVYIDENTGSVYLSTDSDASIGGFGFVNGDVIKITPNVLNTDFALGQLGDAVVTRIFSEDLFASGANIDAMAVLANGHLALSTTNNEILAGRAFGPADVIEYDPGDAVRDPLASVLFSAATFADDNEDINALLVAADGSLAISTDRNAQLGTNPRIRYNVGIRIRGNGTRDRTPKNYRIEIPTDRMLQGNDSLNLNSQFSHAALLGSELFREADMVREKIRAVQLRINGVNPAAGSGSTAANHVNYGSYVQVEAITGRWAEDHISLDPEGNYYRQVGEANLQNAAWTVDQYKVSLDYNKGTNSSTDDWNDLVSLAQALNISPESSTYLDEISQVININQWLRHMAVQALLANDEGGIGTMRGDDTALYRGTIDTRFIIAPHDLDTTLGFSKDNVNQDIIHRRNNTYTNLSNLITHPALYPLLYGHIEELLATTFNPENMNPLIDKVFGTGDGDWLATVEINSSKQFVIDRAAAIRAEISGGAIVPVSPNNLIDLPEEFRHLAVQQQSLRISEIMFNADGGDKFEYIELVNMAPPGSEPLDLRGVHFTNGIVFGFVEDSPIPSTAPNADVLTLAPGERTLVVSNRQAFLDRYDPDRTNLELQSRIAGEFASGSLSDSGERIRLEGRLGEPILDFRFNDSWFSRTDGQGFSLVLRNDIDAQTPRAAWGDKSTWRSSQFQGGAPGMRDGGLDPNSVVINEMLTHTDANFLGD
ncbi:MAG: CotH kinase family protein, partial [Planctomycetes bacterium]|nr:CotH kinase family protein [Planctomycetota bacterium]